MISCAKWEKRLQRLERRLKVPRIKFIIQFVDPSRKVVGRATFGPNGGLIDLPLEEDEDPKAISPVPTTSVQKAPGQNAAGSTQVRSENPGRSSQQK